MPTPPSLRPSSADRLQSVVEQADAAVDGGTPPDAALAKAAEDHGLPRGHVPLVVRAFNTGRAVRQLAAPSPWEKAASHPVASVEGVVALLSEPVKKAAAPDLADYARPPVAEKTVTLPPPLVGPEAKAAFVKKAEAVPPPPAPRKRDNRMALAYRAAAAFDKFAACVATLTPPQYAAVRRDAFRAAPDAAAYAFPRVEEDYDVGRLAKRAAECGPDPTVRTDHPATLAVREMAAVKAAVDRAAPDHPEDYDKVAQDNGTTLWRARPVCPILGRVIPRETAKAAAAPEPQPGLPLNDPPKSAGFGGGLKSVAIDLPMSAAKASPMIGNALATSVPRPDNFGDRDAGWLQHDLARVDQTAALQDLIRDPRFAGASPQVIADSYRQLHSLAPLAMSNSAVASDLLNRRLQTGPLSYFDLNQLVGIESNLAKARRIRTDEDED